MDRVNVLAPECGPVKVSPGAKLEVYEHPEHQQEQRVNVKSSLFHLLEEPQTPKQNIAIFHKALSQSKSGRDRGQRTWFAVPVHFDREASQKARGFCCEERNTLRGSTKSLAVQKRLLRIDRMVYAPRFVFSSASNCSMRSSFSSAARRSSMLSEAISDLA